MATFTVSLGAWNPAPRTWRGTIVMPAAVATVPTNVRRDIWVGWLLLVGHRVLSCASRSWGGWMVAGVCPGRRQLAPALAVPGWSRLAKACCRDVSHITRPSVAPAPGARRGRRRLSPPARTHGRPAGRRCARDAAHARAPDVRQFDHRPREVVPAQLRPGPVVPRRQRQLVEAIAPRGARPARPATAGSGRSARRRRSTGCGTARRTAPRSSAFDAQHLGAALRVVDRQVERERHRRGEDAAEVVARTAAA